MRVPLRRADITRGLIAFRRSLQGLHRMLRALANLTHAHPKQLIPGEAHLPQRRVVRARASHRTHAQRHGAARRTTRETNPDMNPRTGSHDRAHRPAPPRAHIMPESRMKFFFILAAAAALVLTPGHASANETDQFLLPTDRPMVDVGRYIS